MGPQAQGFFAGLESSGLSCKRVSQFTCGILTDMAIEALFSMYLTPDASYSNAELTLGGIDTTRYTGSLSYSALPILAEDWELTSTGIYINGKTTTLLDTKRQIIFDSGTSNVLFDTDIAEVSLPF